MFPLCGHMIAILELGNQLAFMTASRSHTIAICDLSNKLEKPESLKNYAVIHL